MKVVHIWLYSINFSEHTEKRRNMTTYKHRFDFDVGYLIKSPCKNCDTRPDFPKCADQCEILDRIHGILCGTVSSTKGFSALESYIVSMESWGRK